MARRADAATLAGRQRSSTASWRSISPLPAAGPPVAWVLGSFGNRATISTLAWGKPCEATLGDLSPSRFDAAQGGDVATVDNFKGPIFIHTDEISRWWDHQLAGGTNPDVFAVNS